MTAATEIVAEPGAEPVLSPELESGVRSLVVEHGRQGRAILPALRLLRDALGPLTDDVLRAAAPLLEVRAADLRDLARTAGEFVVGGRPAHEVVVCVHRHCRALGALRLLEALERETGATPGRIPPGGAFRLDTAFCLGACTLGPNVLVDGACWHAVTPSGMLRIVRPWTPASSPRESR